MKEYIAKLEALLDLYFAKKAPPLPQNIKEAIVKYAPYIVIVVTILSLPGLLFALGVNSIYPVIAGVGGNGYRAFSATGLIFLVSLGLQVMAIPGLFKHTLSAWRLMFYSSIINLLYQLVILDLLGLIVGGAISFYFLFQIKSLYISSKP